MISLNQVLEHVPDPVKFIRQCIRLLRPAGVIAIAVPSREGILSWDPYLPENWPPHHISRWRRRDFEQLATRCDLRVVESGGDRLLGRAIEAILLTRRKHRIALAKGAGLLSPILIRFLSFAYRKLGLKFIFTKQGHSIYCFLQPFSP
jgi:SAM-dependent methyltransferase